MTGSLRKKIVLLVTLSGLAISPLAISHFDDSQIPQSYRQSYFTLLAMNFGPIGAMVKGEMPWDDAMLKTFADELGALASMDVSRAFAPGSDKGTTRAKPGIWDNPDDFRAKLGDMQEALLALQEAAGTGDKETIAGAVGAAGKACKRHRNHGDNRHHDQALGRSPLFLAHLITLVVFSFRKPLFWPARTSDARHISRRPRSKLHILSN